MSKIKNWALAFFGILLIVLDLGFDEINPLLMDLGLSPIVIKIVKVIFGIYGIYKLKKQLPTQNVEKLKDMVNEKDLCNDK